MRQKLLHLLLLFIAATAIIAEEKPKSVLVEFPVAILSDTSAVWIKWAAPLNPTTGYPDKGTIKLSRDPGGSDPKNYPLAVDMSGADKNPNEEDNLAERLDGKTPVRGIKFIPANHPEIEPGIYYLVVSHNDTLVSNEIQFIVRHPKAPALISPKNDTIDNVTPTFKWKTDINVPYYHVIVSDEKIDFDMDAESLEGLSIIWQAITTGDSIVYGSPDPSGTITATPPPLSPKLKYNWMVLNNYGNHPAMTSVVAPGIGQFELKGEPLQTPATIFPATNDTITTTGELTFRWNNLDPEANTYKVYIYTEVEIDSNASAQMVVWDGEVTAGDFNSGEGSITIDAGNILTANDYSWNVIAVNKQGHGSASKHVSFRYEVPSGYIRIETYEQIINSRKTNTGIVYDTITPVVGLVKIETEVLDGSLEEAPFFYTDTKGTTKRSRPIGTVRLTATRDGFQPQTKTVTIDEKSSEDKPQVVKFYLKRPNATAYGSVFDENEIAITAAKVMAVSDRGDTIYAESDARGNFVLSCYEEDWEVSVSLAGYTSDLSRKISLQSGENQAIAKPFTLTQNNYILNGTVVNDDKQPVAQVTVELLNQDGSKVLTDTTTSSTGQFRFFVNSGTYLIKATKNGFVTKVDTLRDVVSSIEKEVTLSAGAALIKGHIYGVSYNSKGDADTAAITNITVAIVDTTTNDTVVTTKTGSVYAEFTASVKAGVYKILYNPVGYSINDNSIKTIEVTSGKTYTIENYVTAYASISGSVKYLSGAPTGDVTISLTDIDDKTLFFKKESFDDGYFEIANITDGKYTITAAAEKYSLSEITAQLLDNTTTILQSTDTIFIGKGRLYLSEEALISETAPKEEVITSLSFAMKEAKDSVLWTINYPTDITQKDSTTLKIATPLTKILYPLVTNKNQFLLAPAPNGTYTYGVNVSDKRYIDCSYKKFDLLEDVGTLEQVLYIPFYHYNDTVIEPQDSIRFVVENKFSTTVKDISAKIYYKGINDANYLSKEMHSVVGNELIFYVKPKQTGLYMQYYFEIITEDGNAKYGSNKEVYTTYLKANPNIITKLSLSPFTEDSIGYTLPLEGKLYMELNAFYGGGFEEIKEPLAEFCSWQVDASTLTLEKDPNKSAATVVGTAATEKSSITVTFNPGTKYSFAEGVEKSISLPIKVTNSKVDSLTVTTSNGRSVFFNPSTNKAQFVVEAFDSTGVKFTISPQWSVEPTDGGTIDAAGFFTPDTNFFGPIEVTATLYDSLKSISPINIAYSIKNSDGSSAIQTISDKRGLTITYPQNVVAMGKNVNITVNYPQEKNKIYKLLPQDGVSLISDIYAVERLKGDLFTTTGASRADEDYSDNVKLSLQIPEKYYDLLDKKDKSHFTLAVWEDDSLTWDYTWKDEDAADSAKDSSLIYKKMAANLTYDEVNKTFTTSLGSSLNKQSLLKYGVLFRETSEVEASVSISPNPFSPFVTPKNTTIDSVSLSTIENIDNVTGTCIKVTPMNSTTTNSPKITVNIYTATGTMVWNTELRNTIGGKDYYIFWDGKTRIDRDASSSMMVKEDYALLATGDRMCRNGRYFAVITVDDGKNKKRFTKEIILFK